MDSQRPQNNSIHKDNANTNRDKKGGKQTKGNKNQIKEQMEQEMNNAKQALIQKNFDEAQEIAFQALRKFKDDLGGDYSILIVPLMLLSADICIQMGNLEKAENYSAAAYQNYLNYTQKEQKDSGNRDENDQHSQKAQADLTDEEKMQYKGTLHKIFSKLFFAQQKYDKAIEELKSAIYIDSMKYGPMHIQSTFNYYQMGNIFISIQEYDKGEAFFAKTVEIWYKHFKKQQAAQYNEELFEFIEETDQIVINEAYEIIDNILNYFQHKYQDDDRQKVFLPILNCFRSLAFISRNSQDEEGYKKFIHHAFYECQQFRGDQHQKTLKLKNLCLQAGEFQEVEDQEGEGEFDEQEQYQQYTEQQQQLQQQQYEQQMIQQNLQMKNHQQEEFDENELQMNSNQDQQELIQEASREQFQQQSQEYTQQNAEPQQLDQEQLQQELEQGFNEEENQGQEEGEGGWENNEEQQDANNFENEGEQDQQNEEQ